jgi:chromosome segregation ATPase
VNEDRLREENERLGDQLRKDAEALERLRLELEELRRQREYEQRQVKARHDALLQRAEAAETRVAELDAVRQRAEAAETRVAELDAVRQRAEAAETRVAELDAEIREGILGRVRGVCQVVRSTLQAHWPGAGGR